MDRIKLNNSAKGKTSRRSALKTVGAVGITTITAGHVSGSSADGDVVIVNTVLNTNETGKQRATTVEVDGTSTAVDFGASSDAVSVSPGAQTVTVFAGTDEKDAASQQLVEDEVVVSQKNTFLLVYGTVGKTSRVGVTAVTPPQGGNNGAGQLNLLNGCPGAAISLVAMSEDAPTLATEVGFGNLSSYVVPPQEMTGVEVVGNFNLSAPKFPASFAAGENRTLVSAGFPNDASEPFGIFQIIH